MRTKPKSFRLTARDIKLLEVVHEFYMNNFEERAAQGNMNNLYRWSYAQTLAVCIRDAHEALVKAGKLPEISEEELAAQIAEEEAIEAAKKEANKEDAEEAQE